MNINATLLLQAIVFAIFVWFTMRFVWPPITKALDERAVKIADGLAAADRAKSELAQANRQVEQQLAATRDEATKRLADAERLAQRTIEDAKANAKRCATVSPNSPSRGPKPSCAARSTPACTPSCSRD